MAKWAVLWGWLWASAYVAGRLVYGRVLSGFLLGTGQVWAVMLCSGLYSLFLNCLVVSGFVFVFVSLRGTKQPHAIVGELF